MARELWAEKCYRVSESARSIKIDAEKYITHKNTARQLWVQETDVARSKWTRDSNKARERIAEMDDGFRTDRDLRYESDSAGERGLRMKDLEAACGQWKKDGEMVRGQWNKACDRGFFRLSADVHEVRKTVFGEDAATHALKKDCQACSESMRSDGDAVSELWKKDTEVLRQLGWVQEQGATAPVWRHLKVDSAVKNAGDENCFQLMVVCVCMCVLCCVVFRIKMAAERAACTKSSRRACRCCCVAFS